MTPLDIIEAIRLLEMATKHNAPQVTKMEMLADIAGVSHADLHAAIETYRPNAQTS